MRTINECFEELVNYLDFAIYANVFTDSECDDIDNIIFEYRAQTANED